MGAQGTEHMADSKQPNFVFIITDQHRADHLGCYGHPVLKTPHIDSLAARGRSFDKFYVSCAICMPNRSTLMTGRMPSVHGVRHNGIPLDQGEATFVDLLREQGYSTALIGKSHLQNMTNGPAAYGRPEPEEGKKPAPERFREARVYNHGDEAYDQETPERWDEHSTFDVKTPFYGFETVKLQTGHGDEVGGDYTRWLEGRHENSRNLRGAENQLDHDYTCPQAWRTAIPEEDYPTSYITQHSLEYLDEHAKSNGDKPFFMMMSYPDPHHPFTPPGKYWDMYKPEDMVIPESFHTNTAPPPNVAWAHERRENGTQVTTSQSLFALAEEQHLREALALTCGMISMIDDSVGQILAKLDELGMADNTVVVFTTDHGDLLGDHQLILKGPIHYHGLIRVPFIWADTPDRASAGFSSALSSTVDIAQTILDRAGLDPYYGIQGRSLLPEIGGAEDQGSGAALVEQEEPRPYFGLKQPIRLRTLVTDRYRMSIYHGVEWGEIYDLEQDPGEINNLWDDPDFVATKAMLMEKLAREEMAAVDYSPLPLKTA